VSSKENFKDSERTQKKMGRNKKTEVVKGDHSRAESDSKVKLEGKGGSREAEAKFQKNKRNRDRSHEKSLQEECGEEKKGKKQFGEAGRLRKGRWSQEL